MPAIFTHIQFGKEVVEELPAHLRKLAKEYPAPFYLGTQGPDILFYHKPLKKKSKNPARKKGWDLHAVPPETFFVNGARLLLSDERNFDGEGNFRPDSPEAAYLLGFLCHFTLDSACHPEIDGNSKNGLTHGKIESELDKYQFRKVGLPERGYNAAKLFSPSKEAQTACARVLEVSEKNAAVALRSMRKINGLFSHKRGFVHGFCHGALTLVGQNGTFGEMFLHKKEDERCKALLPLLEDELQAARSTAREHICDFFENAPAYATKGKIGRDFYRYDYSGIFHEEEN